MAADSTEIDISGDFVQNLEFDLREMLWKKIKYEWLSVMAYQSFQSLADHVLNVQGEI
ncbi:hypothetical protein [Pseudomonas fluorescens]|uniref:hypothetical protein n=1 Tax=Pseudomonas fluorescens TaxID=294 RepID=UPI003CFFCD8D